MSEDGVIEENGDRPVREGRSVRAWTGRFFRNVLIGVAGLAAIVMAILALLDTSPGHRFVADRIAALQFESGMQIAIGRIDGSIYGTMTIHDLSIRDPKGEFLYSPETHVDWRPFAFVSSHLDVRSATAERIFLRRVPEFHETPPSSEPLLPDFNIDIGKLQIDRFIAEKAVTGEQQIAAISGKAHIASGRAEVEINGRTIAANGKSGGDKLAVILDAVPEANRLDIALDLQAPGDGVIAALAGLTQPLEIKADGKGDWDAWDGRIVGKYANANIADLNLRARNGTFGLYGRLRPGSLVSGPTANLLSPETRVNLAAQLAERKADISGTVTSDAIRLTANGGVDLSENTFDDLKIDFDLLRPSALAENVQGSGVGAHLALDGAFSTPRVAYTINAARIVFNDMGLVNFQASGKATVDAERILIPVNARAGQITGLDTVAGGTLADVRLNGDLAIQGPRVLSDNMRVRSDRIDATAVLLADTSKGFYTGAIDGKIANYRVESVGIFNIETDVDLKSEKSGFALQGKVRARSTKLLNASVEEYLGGNFVASSDVRYGGDGVVRLANLRLEAPDLRIVGGSGFYHPDGRIGLVADGTSARYGTLSVRVKGTMTNPDARLKAERPDLGIGLANLDARITGARNGYRFDLTGDTDYGPLSADVILATRGAMQLQINSANLSGVDFTGTLTQTAAGPFAGILTAKGNGLGGIVKLDASGKYQRAVFSVRAKSTKFDGPAMLSIGTAIIDGHAILYDQPEIVADAQLADTRYGSFYLNAARGKINYRGGSGQARALVEGTAGAPFRIAVNADMEPKLWRIMLDGKSRGIEFKTASPARIVPDDGSYELLPATLEVGGGKIRLAGNYGKGMKLQSRLEGVNIAIANAFVPGLGLGGTATGSLDFVQATPNAFPRADARIRLNNFTRTSAASISQPVDVNFVGKLLPDGADMRAVVRRGGSVVGRLVATLQPLPPGSGPWMTRLMEAPLGGGMRYNGPAGTLFSFAGQPDQSLDGPLGVAVDFSCRVSDPCLTGVVRGKGLTYTNATYGTRLSKMDVSGRFTGNRLQIENLTATAGKGTIDASGYISLAADAGYPMDVTVDLEHARLARSEMLSGSATGQLRLTKSAGEFPLLSGKIELPETRYKIIREGAAEVPQLTGVSFRPPRGGQRVTGNEVAESIASTFGEIRLDVDVRADEKLYVSGMGLESEWKARFKVAGTNTAPVLTGNVDLVRGTLDFGGRSFELVEGTINFNGGKAIDPSIRIVATSDVEDVSVSVNIDGTAYNPQITFNSVPSLPQDEILARVLFGSSIANLSAIQAVQLASSLNTLRGGGGGLNPLGKLQSATGIDRLRILGADEASGRETALAAGQYITDDIYIELVTDTKGFTATQLEVSITPWLSVLSQAGGSGTSSVNVRVKKDY